MDEDLCTYDVADGIATLTFNRPDSMNGMTGNMEVAYFQRLLQAQDDRDVRVIVVTGAGRAFCPGADLAHRAGPDDHSLPNGDIAQTEVTASDIELVWDGLIDGERCAFTIEAHNLAVTERGEDALLRFAADDVGGDESDGMEGRHFSGLLERECCLGRRLRLLRLSAGPRRWVLVGRSGGGVHGGDLA